MRFITFRFQLVEDLLEKDYKMKKKHLYYMFISIIVILILYILGYSFRYQWFIRSIVDQKYKIGLNRDIKMVLLLNTRIFIHMEIMEF